MPYRMLDVYAAYSVEQLVADVDAAGASAVGLYVVNWSAGNARSADVVKAVEAQRGVLRIVTPGNNPPMLEGAGKSAHDARKALLRKGKSPRTKLAPLGAGGIEAVVNAVHASGGAGKGVAFDLETYSFPSYAWVEACWAVLRQLGCQVWEYGVASTFQSYPEPDVRWIADWNPGTDIPAGYGARQYGDSTVVNGRTYDGSMVRDGISVGGGGVGPSVPSTTDLAAHQQVLLIQGGSS